MGVVEELITGRDGVVRCAKLRAGKSHLERAIQHLYLLELTLTGRRRDLETNWILMSENLPHNRRHAMLHEMQENALQLLLQTNVISDHLFLLKLSICH